MFNIKQSAYYVVLFYKTLMSSLKFISIEDTR